ncbi:lysophospholipase L1-like esterase [Aeromicrobium panaciterrae]|uniref:Lysophospholipase L1-like esterase n=1 Tax=Aeromicrobium panaciterrae TaxID=363861 RepID=A0ABU1UQT2_9ACTN|nr:SGNH/GDSL hydrolase family protein [Aeromicrobium panaciterrae]MDR7087546.1 lysophospholipase L1-like esterase [Aeromicrobium panaciterrae]
MVQQRTAVRTPILIALVLAALLGPFLARSAIGGEPSAISTVAPRGIVVVGDSITARYNDTPGDDKQGWWSIVGRHYDAKVTTYAQSGSGYLRPGKLCTGNRFIDRQEAFAGEPPSLLIIEGGRNDWAECDGDQFVTATDGAIEHAVDTYLSTLRAFLPRSTRIIVMGPPWGPLDPANGERVTAIIKAAASRHGLEFIPTTGALTEARVLDGVHPNREGSVAIANRVISTLG